MSSAKPAAERVPSLAYQGTDGHPHLSGIPSTDLTPDDLAHLAGRPDVQRRFGSTAATVAAALIKTGLYASASASADDGKE